jgi:hypothetical protein
MLHNTCRRSGVHFSEVTSTLTVDLLFKINWKTPFFVPRMPHNTCRTSGVQFRRWPWPLTYFSRSTGKRVFCAPNATQHLQEVWGTFFGADLDLDHWPTFQGQLENAFFCPKCHTTLAGVWGAIFGGDLVLDRWPTFQGQLETRFFVPRMPHNTCWTSGVRILEVTSTLTVDQQKMYFSNFYKGSRSLANICRYF